MLIVALLLSPQFVVVLASVALVPICELRHIAHSLPRLLKHWQTNRHIVGSTIVRSICIFEILLTHISEQLRVVGSEMAADEGVVAVGIVRDDTSGVRFGVSCSATHADEEVGVDEPGLVLLEDGIEQF